MSQINIILFEIFKFCLHNLFVKTIRKSLIFFPSTWLLSVVEVWRGVRGEGLILFLFPLMGFAQTITVLDKTTQEPLAGVIVYSNNPVVNVITNAKGQFDVAPFKTCDSIFFKMVGYFTSYFTFSEIEGLNFKVELTENPTSINEVVISANLWEESKLDVSCRYEKINMKAAAFQNPQTTADLLGTSGYVFIQKSQMGGGSPMLRGMATNRVLLVVDGVRMNNAIFRSGNVQSVISLDVNALERTEILFGPGSVMYGSDAIGGVMNFHTLTPKFSDSTSKKPFTFGNALMRTSTANSEMTGHLDFNIGFHKIALVTSFTHAKYGDMRSGNHGGSNYFYRQNYVQTINDKDYMFQNEDSTLQIGSKYSQTNFMQKVLYKPFKSLEIDYSFHFSEIF